MIWEIIQFFIYSGLIVLISKYALVTTLRKLAENLNLKAKIVGNISGYATSMPELLTVSTASISGLASASIVNILSSNIINFIQYLGAILVNKNRKELKNKGIQINLILVVITILIPIFLISCKIEMNLFIVPIFIFLYIMTQVINYKAHKKYLQEIDQEIEIESKEKIEEEIGKENKQKTNKKKKTIKYMLYLISIAFLLYVVGELLGNTLDSLCYQFNISQTIIGILLGFITSIPELMTFFEAQKHHKKQNNEMLGVVEATNNLLTSNILNLFIIQSIGMLLFSLS